VTTVTLEHIKAEHARLGELIAQFVQTPADMPRELHLEETTIELEANEHYAGTILNADGTIDYHLVLLPGEREKTTWQDAIDWAETIGGALPTRSEQALLYANLKAQFQPAWYWSAEQHESDGSCAWYQYFDDGNQISNHESWQGRARAVRRFTA
jgi:hypothetical protein